MSEPIKGLLSVNSYHYVRGGSDAMYFSHAQVFQRAGWENTFFSMKHPDNRPCDTEQYFAERIDFDMSVGLAERMIQAGRIIYSRQAESRLLALLNTRRVDVAHFHCIYHHLSPSVLVAARRRGIPTVMTAHDLKIACPAYKMMNSGGVCERCKGGKVWNVLTHRCIKDSSAASALIAVESAVHKSLRLYDRFTDRIVVPSRFYFDKLVEWGWRPEKLAYVPNFIEPPPTVPTGVGDYFLYLGRIATEKGLRTFVRAAALAGVPVKIAGTGPDLQSLQQFAQTLAAPVEFVGFKSGEALWSLVD
ncbi:MAG: glycosyltransferase family 1 protein, partial [Hyphomicrobiales bacterium]